MKLQTTFTPNQGPNLRDKLGDLLNNQDFIDYLTEKAGVEQVLNLGDKKNLKGKAAMYAYYQKVLIPLAVEAYTNAGYPMMNDLVADYKLKAQCATSFTIDPEGNQEAFMEDKSSMSKKRLHKYLTDSIFHLENDLGVNKVPGAEEFKSKQQTGYSFSSVIKPNTNF